MTELLYDLIAFFEARNTGNATNELLKRCKKEKDKQLLIHSVVVPKGTLCDETESNRQNSSIATYTENNKPEDYA